MLVKTVILTISEYKAMKEEARKNGWVLIEDTNYSGEGGSRVGIYTTK